MTLKSLKRQVYFLLILTILLGGLLVQKSFASCICNSSRLSNVDYGCQNGEIRDNYVDAVARACTRVETAQEGNCAYYSNCLVTECPVCPSSGLVTPTYNYCYCTTEIEADSLECVLNGNNWVNGVCSSCDPEKYTCETRTEQNTEETSSDQITCIGGTCYGVAGCKYWSTYTTTCVNECGTNATQESYSTDPIFQEGACDSADFNGECTETLCVEIDDRYIIYQKCLTDNITNGELEWIPKIQNAGKGSCASVGFKNTPLDSLRNSSSDSSSVDSISTDCLLYGACSSYSSDTTDFSNPFNRTSENGCTCDDDNGSSSISRIVCPDGSMTYEIGSCDDWSNKHSSSSSATTSSSSSAEGGGTSEGGDWATNIQAEDIKDSLGSINGTLKAIGSLISALNPTWSEGETGTLTPEQLEMVFGAGEYGAIFDYGVDSVTSWVDSLDIDSSNYQNSLDSMFSAFPTSNTLIDTLSFTSASKCPVFNLPFFGETYSIDCSSLGGFDLCEIVSLVLTMFATFGILSLQIKMIIRAFAG